MDRRPSPLRSTLTSVLLWLSFVSACLFYGVGENVMLLFLSAGFLLAAAALIPVATWLTLYEKQKTAFWLCLYLVAVLTVAYQIVTISADSSFAMSWALALPALWYLVYSANEQRRGLLLALAATVVLFAVQSVIAYVVWGTRAYQPLGDPNHYASLLYLLWIPLAHLNLRAGWQAASGWRLRILGHLLLFVVALALAATGSRVGMTIIAMALAGWLLFTLIRRLPIVPWLQLAATTAAALLVWWLLLPESMPDVLDAQYFQAGVGIRASMNLATLDMALAAPLTGHGVFTYPMLYPLFRLPGDQSSSGMFAHNDYLQLLAEAGPWLVVVLLVVLVAVLRRLWRALFDRDSDALSWFGLAMAAAALLAHAGVNYVFYYLPLAIAFAVVCAELFASPVRGAEELAAGDASISAAGTADSGVAVSAPIMPVRMGVVTGITAAFVFWVFLGLDVVVQGVFGGQLAPGPIGSLKRDFGRMVRFAGVARKLNAERVTPILAEAALYEALLESGQESAVSKQAILERYRLAIAMDPYNPNAYQSCYDFLRRFGDRALFSLLEADESPSALLLKVVQLNLGQTPRVFDLLALYDRQGDQQAALSLLKITVFPWLERVHWSQPANSAALLEEMQRRAELAGDEVFLAQIDQKAEYLASVRPGHRVEQLRFWQRDLFR